MATTETAGPGGSGNGIRRAVYDQAQRPRSLTTILEEVERHLIFTALCESHGNKAKAARALGISERLMGLRVERLGIDWRALRSRHRRPTGSSP